MEKIEVNQEPTVNIQQHQSNEDVEELVDQQLINDLASLRECV